MIGMIIAVNTMKNRSLEKDTIIMEDPDLL